MKAKKEWTSSKYFEVLWREANLIKLEKIPVISFNFDSKIRLHYYFSKIFPTILPNRLQHPRYEIDASSQVCMQNLQNALDQKMLECYPA